MEDKVCDAFSIYIPHWVHLEKICVAKWFTWLLNLRRYFEERHWIRFLMHERSLSLWIVLLLMYYRTLPIRRRIDVFGVFRYIREEQPDSSQLHPIGPSSLEDTLVDILMILVCYGEHPNVMITFFFIPLYSNLNTAFRYLLFILL